MRDAFLLLGWVASQRKFQPRIRLGRKFRARDPAGRDVLVCWEDNRGKGYPGPVLEPRKMNRTLPGRTRAQSNG
jgi:hypothetical protein